MGRADYFKENAEIFICPRCGGKLLFHEDDVQCDACRVSYPIVSNIPMLFWNDELRSDKTDITENVKNFYETNPFPGYDDLDDVAQLIQKAKKSIFAQLLDEQLPFNIRVLEAGCGTGQLSNFLSIAHRDVIGVDMCETSLKLAETFRENNGLHRARFIQMNLFAPVFRPEVFHVVISNGVLHHTADPFLAFQNLSRLVKPGGYVLIGLYHKYGRLATDVRRSIFKLAPNRFRVLDGRMRSTSIGANKKEFWFADQYRNPRETKHTFGEVLNWFHSAGFEFVKSIPKLRINSSFKSNERLFMSEKPGGRLERLLVEMSLGLSGTEDGGVFLMIGRKIS